MEPSIREIPARVRNRILLLHSAGPAVACVMTWIMYLSQACFQVDLPRLLSRRPISQDSTDPTSLYLILTLLATILAPAFTWFQVRKAMSLARSGKEVQAVVKKMGQFSKAGLVKATCEYRAGGQTYYHSWSHNIDTPLAIGDSVALLVDPKNPKRCMRKDEILIAQT